MADTMERLRAAARRLGCGAVAFTVGLALFGPGAVRAQVPEQVPELVPSSTTTTPGPTTTLIPPLAPSDPLLPPPDGDEPGSEEPGPALLPAPAPAPAPAPSTSRTTTFTTSPMPPRTPVRATASSLPTARASTVPATVAADEREGGDPEGEGPSTLAYDGQPEGGSDVAAGLNDVELGVQASHDQTLGSLASIAAGLIASVLLGIVLWVRGQVRHPEREPDDTAFGW